MTTDRPSARTRTSGKWPALVLAVIVHVAFIAVLIFSLRWQNREPQAVTAELYAPPAKTAPVEAPTPPPAKAVPAETPPSPPPTKPEPVPEPTPKRPPPSPPPKPEPKAEKPDNRAAIIAEKARREEEERKKRDKAAQEKKEREKKELDQREADKRKREEQQAIRETQERQRREAEALKAQAEREQVARAAQQAKEAEASARSRAEADYIRRIQSKVRGNVTLPPDITGNPEAIFDVVQLPTGEIIDAVLRKSSGSKAYDDAVARAIVKSSPLPRPDRPELFQRTLTLKFRPQD